MTILALFVDSRVLGQAEANTTAGVAAFNRGDYQRAAAILAPIAEQFPLHDDYTAEWFMALMYETGRGVPEDHVRACALYYRVLGFDWQAPGADVVIEKARDAYFALERPLAERCQLLSNLGLRHGFQDVTFDLGPGHWVNLELDRAIVSYQGAEKRFAFADWAPGTLFLPSDHTELTAGQSQPTRRHFIEISSWRPDQRGEWTLTWQVFEVVRTEWVQVAAESLKTVRDDAPPRSMDIHALAHLRVDETGGVEWVVLGGSESQHHRIESEAERTERLERERARVAAERRIDWSLRHDVGRNPALKYGDADGCVNIFVVGWSDDHTEAITLRADGDLLQLSPTPQTFDLAVQRPGLELTVHVYERPMSSSSSSFCTDVIRPSPPEERWRAIRGTVTIEVSPGRSEDGESIRRATVRIVGAQFIRGDGVRADQVAPIVLSARVGFFFG